MTYDHASRPGTPRPGGTGARPGSVADVAGQPGRPLDGELRARMSRRFGTDLSFVRVHDDDRAATTASDLRADAWTLGPHIGFAAGAFRPDTPRGDRLLQHELTHVLQQRRASAWEVDAAARARVEDDPALESDARQVAAGGFPRGIDSPARVARQPSGQQADEGTHTGGGAAGINSAYDAHVRLTYYVDEARTISQQVLDDLDSGRVDHRQARELASRLRNEALNATRERLTPGGAAVSEAIKEEGRTLPELLAIYSERIVRSDPARFGLSVADLANPERVRAVARGIQDSEEVSRAIVSAAGRTSRAMTVVARVSRVAGPLGVAASLGSSIYEISQAEPGVETARVATREAGGFAGGWLGASAGGLAAGWTASLLCGPGAAVCAIVVTLVVVGAAAYTGGRAGEWASESAFEAMVFTVPRAVTGTIVSVAEGAVAVGQGLSAAVTGAATYLIDSVTGSLDPMNWELSPDLPARARADLQAVGFALWAQIRPGSVWVTGRTPQSQLQGFLTDANRPLSSYRIPAVLLVSIAGALNQALDRRGAPTRVTPDQILGWRTTELVVFLRDNGLLAFRQEPADHGRELRQAGALRPSR
ncbi:DUF4157 domain-containing protein [Geodermatophilus sp. SYSU D00691]